MLYLLAALLGDAVRPDWVGNEAELFVRNISVMFVPLGVGIVAYISLLKSQAIPVSGTLIISFLITILVTAKTVELLRSEKG